MDCDPITQTVTLCILDRAFYNATEFQGDDRILSPTFPDLTLTAAQVLADRL